jgi:putative transposase
LFVPRSHFYLLEITSVRLAGRMGAEMWTEAHRARHEAGLKQMVSTCAVEELARWLERVDPPRSEKATPVLPVISAIAWHLRVGGPWRALPGDFPAWRTVYGWFRRWLELGVFDRLLCDVARLRRRAAGRTPEPTLGIIDTQSVKCIPVRGHRSCDPSAKQPVAEPPEGGYDAAKKVLGRKRVALVDADGTWLAIAVVPASTQERDTLPALDVGKAEWPSLRQAILDGGFVAERCREWSNAHGMRHHVVERDPGQKGFVVLERRWVVERSFGWLAHWGGLLRDRAGRLDVSAARVAFAAVLSGVEALLNPMPIHAAAS